MTFNWPDIPFSGTEVDAFVVEYKALAQAIIDDYDDRRVNLTNVKLPFQRREDVKIFLEYGLTYAAFIVKQRAGNSGPGGDFQLGNSPLSLVLPPLTYRKNNRKIVDQIVMIMLEKNVLKIIKMETILMGQMIQTVEKI